MVQWKNLNSFINPLQLPLLCEASGTILIALVGLMTGRQASWLAGRRITRKFLIYYNFSLCLAKVQHYYSNTNAFKYRNLEAIIFIAILAYKYYHTQ